MTTNEFIATLHVLSHFSLFLFFFNLLLEKKNIYSALTAIGVLLISVYGFLSFFTPISSSNYLSIIMPIAIFFLWLGLRAKEGVIFYLTEAFRVERELAVPKKGMNARSNDRKSRKLSKKKRTAHTGFYFGFPKLSLTFSGLVHLSATIIGLIAGLELVFRGFKKKNVLCTRSGVIFLLYSLSEVLQFLHPGSFLYTLQLILLLAAGLLFIHSIWAKSYLRLSSRYFITTQLISFIAVCCVLIVFRLYFIISEVTFPPALQYIPLLGCLVVLSFVTPFSWLSSRSFSQPLLRIISQTESLRSGKLAPFEAKFSNLEYNRLIDALNIMVHAIDKNREDLESQISQLKELDKLREEFLANVSHELRTPLTMIIGNSELILADLIGEITDEQREFLQPVYDEAQKLLQLITDVLNFSKIERGESELFFEDIHSRELIEPLITKFQPLARHRQIKIFDEVKAFDFRSDAGKLGQIVTHLMSNAIKFNAKGGKVRIRMEKRERLGKEKVLILQIADTGIGIHPDILPTVFEKFRQGDGSATREFGGTGIGLTIVKSFTELLDGEVDVKSVVGKGTQFSLRIPIEEPGGDSGVLTGKFSLQNVDEAQNLILLVESDKKIAKLLKTYLVQEGYNALAVASGKEAMKQIDRLNPDLICLNPQLSDINGWQLLKIIKSKENTSEIPVIITTFMDRRSLARKLGAAGAIELPVTGPEFIKSIKASLNIA